jgi:tetratricopeptide (TPR) repeat protein
MALEDEFSERVENRQDLVNDHAARDLLLRRSLAILAQEPNNEEARIALGDVHVAEGRPWIALKEYERVLEINPRNVKALMACAREHIALNQFAVAENYARRAHDLRPKNAFVLSTIATCVMNQKIVGDDIHNARQDARAIEWFEKSITADPQYAYGYFMLAALHARAGNLQMAAERVIDAVDCAHRGNEGRLEHLACALAKGIHQKLAETGQKLNPVSQSQLTAALPPPEQRH